jgi:hypothetical protein
MEQYVELPMMSRQRLNWGINILGASTLPFRAGGGRDLKKEAAEHPC